MRISTSDGVVTTKLSLFAARFPIMLRLPLLQLLQVQIEPIQPALPDVAILFGPAGHVLQRSRVDPAMPPLRIAAPRDETRAFQDTQVLRNGGHAHLEGLSQFRHRALT